MKYKTILVAFLGTLSFSLSQSTFAVNENTILLSYRVIDSSHDNNTYTMFVKLRAKNTGSNEVHDLAARLISTQNISVDAQKISFGNINPGETVVDNNVFEIKLDSMESQDKPQTETIWEVNYFDENGNLVEEVSVLK